jgi:hypothetical protein
VPDERAVPLPDGNSSEVVPSLGKKALSLLATPYLWMIVGLLCVASSEPLRNWALTRHGLAVEHPPASAPRQPLPSEDTFERNIGLGIYVLEHLGAVLFVAMLVRLAIEKQTQKEAVRGVKDAVNEEVRKAFVDVNAQIGKFIKTVDAVNEKLETIQALTGGSLYAGKLTPADKDEIKALFLNPAFFRPSYHLTLHLTPKGQELTVRITADARLQNISNKPQPFKIEAFLDDFPQPGTISVATASKFHSFEFGPDNPIGRDVARRQPFEVSYGENHTFVEAVGNRLRFKYDPQISIPVEEVYFVKMDAEQQMRTSDLFVWNMQVPTEKFHFKVCLEGDLTTDNFTLIARPMHHGQHDNFAPVKEEKKELIWQIDNVVLPYQGIQLWWSPKTPSDPAIAAPGDPIPAAAGAPSKSGDAPSLSPAAPR